MVVQVLLVKKHSILSCFSVLVRCDEVHRKMLSRVKLNKREHLFVGWDKIFKSSLYLTDLVGQVIQINIATTDRKIRPSNENFGPFSAGIRGGAEAPGFEVFKLELLWKDIWQIVGFDILVVRN